MCLSELKHNLIQLIQLNMLLAAVLILRGCLTNIRISLSYLWWESLRQERRSLYCSVLITWFCLTCILQPHNMMILYFRSPYFHISNNASLSALSISIIISQKCSLGIFYLSYSEFKLIQYQSTFTAILIQNTQKKYCKLYKEVSLKVAPQGQLSILLYWRLAEVTFIVPRRSQQSRATQTKICENGCPSNLGIIPRYWFATNNIDFTTYVYYRWQWFL